MALNLMYNILKLIIMADSKKNVGTPDRTRINVNEDYELQDWSKKFKVTAEELKKAVKQVGTNAQDVEAFLKKGNSAQSKK